MEPPYFLQIATAFFLQPYGPLCPPQLLTDPATIAAVNAAGFGGNCVRIANPNYRPSVADVGTASYANDTDAAAGGVPIGGVYLNGNFVMRRLT